jgi:hypothetical protein
MALPAQPVPVNLSAVPDSLKSKASVIVHAENISIDVASLDNATVKVVKVFTVLNEEGKNALFFQEYATKFIQLDDAEIRVYDAAGKQIAKHKKREMTTVAVGEGLIEEGTVTFFRVMAPAYPVTVEFRYEQKLKSTLAFPAYRFINNKEAVVQSGYTVKVPSEIKLRYQAKNCSLTPQIKEDGKYTTYAWTVGNLVPFQNEEGSSSMRDRFPYVDIVSDQFSHYGFRGDLSSWKSFGAWINSLYTGLDELPAERQQFLQQLVSGAADDKEKARRIYDYLQENFRYVSIQLGIGGLKPFSAQFTDQKKYGDCKALSNYMKAALKAVGIKSYVAIINAGYNEEPVDATFPANNFNHAILCVPGKDSVWLECTSSTAEFNRLGTFTENRNALLITDEGGVLVSTPPSDPGTNTIDTRTLVTVDADMGATTETSIRTTGAYAEIMADMVKDKRDEQKRMLVYYLGYKQPDEFELTAKGAAYQQQTSLTMAVRKLHEFNAGSKYFFNPRVHKIWAGKLPAADNRRQDYFFRHPFIKKDTTVLKFPEGFTPDVLPAEKKLEMAYGSYRAKTWYNEGEKSFYTATTLILKKHRIAAADYKKVKAFFDEVAQDDTQKIVVKRGDNVVADKKAF